ncbi:S-adenosylmethionine decarboxylase [Hyphomicrobium sp. ghe19]|uniref:S-adenosylmethionine decarboxylase n=1 Tax=Hyphomicrobium sp. ghe19 TaxID=2682968 RepID=UPI0013679897|nr:S-adenosylmethionine decarboxylase proenzyme [Hyphomicrobium sp. ghe19]
MSLHPPVEHKQVIIRAEVDWWYHPHQDAQFTHWLENLIDTQNMKIMSGPHVAYCHRPMLEGWSGVVIIETSHVAIHVWDKTDPVLVQLDFYTCGQMNVTAIIEALKAFGLKNYETILLDREYQLEIV